MDNQPSISYPYYQIQAVFKYQLPGEVQGECWLEIFREVARLNKVDTVVVFSKFKPKGTAETYETFIDDLATKVLHDHNLEKDYVKWLVQTKTGCYQVYFSWVDGRYSNPQPKKLWSVEYLKRLKKSPRESYQARLLE